MAHTFPTNGAPSDVFAFTPGFQAAGGLKQRFQMAQVSTRHPGLQRGPGGRVLMLAVDPNNPEVGLQLLPVGMDMSRVPRGLTVYGQMQDGQMVPLKRPSRRRINPANHRATRRAVTRVMAAERHAKKVFRAAARIKKTVKKTRRRRR